MASCGLNCTIEKKHVGGFHTAWSNIAAHLPVSRELASKRGWIKGHWGGSDGRRTGEYSKLVTSILSRKDH